MNKTELITAVAQRAGVTRKDTELVVDALLGTIVDALVSAEKVQITGFGSFEVKERSPRVGRNPHTGEATQIPATRAVGFKPGKALKDAVAEQGGEGCV